MNEIRFTAHIVYSFGCMFIQAEAIKIEFEI